LPTSRSATLRVLMMNQVGFLLRSGTNQDLRN